MKPIKSSRLKIIQKQNRAEYIIIKIIIKSVIQHYDSFHLRVLMTQGLLICHKMKTLLLIGCWGGSEAALSSLVHTGAPESTTGPLKCNSVLKLLQTSGVCQVCVRCVTAVWWRWASRRCSPLWSSPSPAGSCTSSWASSLLSYWASGLCSRRENQYTQIQTW